MSRNSKIRSSKKNTPGKKTQERVNNSFSDGKHIRWVSLTLLMVCAFIVFYPSLMNGFVYWDDGPNVFENPNIQSLSMDHIKSIFSTSLNGNYNPLTILTFAIDYHFYRLDPFGYHLVNILFHLVNVLLVYFLIRNLGLGHWGGILVAFLFSIHPMRVESVTWITERKDVLFGMFYLFSLVCYLKYRATRKIIWSVLVYLTFILSLLSKIQAVALPLTLLVIDFYMERSFRWKLVLGKIPLFLLSLATGLVGIYFLLMQKSINTIQYSLFDRMLSGSYTLVIYLVKVVIPYKMSAIYSYPNPGDFTFLFYASPFILILLCGLVIYSVKKTRVVATGSLFFLVNVIFVLQVVGAGQAFLADRFTYIPYIGLFFIAGAAFSWIVRNRPGWIPLTVTGIIVYIIILSLMTWNYAKTWKNTETLFTHVIETDENAVAAYLNRAVYLREHKEYDKALVDLNKAIFLKQSSSNYYDRGTLLFGLGKYKEAFNDFSQVLKSDSANSSALMNMGAIYGKRKQYDSALYYLTASIRINPKEKDAWLNLAALHYEKKRYPEAIRACDVYLTIKKDDPGMVNLRGLCKVNLGRYPEALTDYNLSIEMDPGNGSFYLNRSFLYNFTGDKEKAYADAKKAQSLGIKINEQYLSTLIAVKK